MNTDPIDSLDHRQRRFAEHVADGKSVAIALLSAGYDPDAKNFPLLPAKMKDNPAVQALIADLCEKRRPLESMTKPEAVDILTRLVRANARNALPENSLCTVEALKLLAGMHGWNAPAEAITNVIVEAGGEIPIKHSEA